MADKSTECVTKEYMDQIFVALKDRLDEIVEKVDEIGTKAVAKKSGRGGSGKRKPSLYNRFISVCMKGTGKTMKTCAAEYKVAKSDGTIDSIVGPDKAEGIEE